MKLKTQGKVYVILLFTIYNIFNILSVVECEDVFFNYVPIKAFIYFIFGNLFGLSAIIIAIFTPKDK